MDNRLLFGTPVPWQIRSKAAPLKVDSQGSSQGTLAFWLCFVKISLTLVTVKTQNEALKPSRSPSWDILQHRTGPPGCE